MGCTGCELIEEPDHRVSKETLEGMGGGDWDSTERPYMLHREGNEFHTMGTVFLQKPAAAGVGQTSVVFHQPA